MLVEHGLASEAKARIESRMQRLSVEATSSDAATELAALRQCFVLDVLCDGLRDFDGATEWLSVKGAQHGSVGIKPPEGGVPMAGERGSATDIAGLLLEVQRRREAACSSTARQKGSSVARETEEYFTMTGEMSDGDWPECTFREERGSAEAMGSSVQPVAVESSQGRGKIAAQTAVPRFLSLPPGATSRIKLGSGGIRALYLYVLDAARKSWVTTEASRMWLRLGIDWRQALFALASCTVVFALVAESRALGAAAKRWWRDLRAALRGLVAELLALGFSTPTPVARPTRT